ncbi:TPA: hypothetical protein ACSP3K_001569 [Aeromonas veronii]|uniref:hypothetical protein n=1 Tax=Aeromonas TaxID=642 RepID=UPI001F2BC7C5|nr:hypothetical protein [Aeromonas veronii]MCF5866705.1 hypothetical protein [Aeromonas veronii]
MRDEINLPSDIGSEVSYEKAKRFWRQLLSNLTFDQEQQQITEEILHKISYLGPKIRKRRRFVNARQFSNISLETDGNPIFYCQLHDINKSLRIIQEEPTLDGLQVGAWVEKASEYKDYDEFVLSLELTSESYRIAKPLIYYWLFYCDKNEDMEQVISHFIN